MRASAFSRGRLASDENEGSMLVDALTARRNTDRLTSRNVGCKGRGRRSLSALIGRTCFSLFKPLLNGLQGTRSPAIGPVGHRFAI
jgi:hypothetical protein